MRFLIDAQLPRGMRRWLVAAGCDAIHTQDLPDANQTDDVQIIAFADQDQRAVITKDSDFVDSHLVFARPAKRVLISTGNVSNKDLETLVTPLISALVRELQIHSFLEIGWVGLVVRG